MYNNPRRAKDFTLIVFPKVWMIIGNCLYTNQDSVKLDNPLWHIHQKIPSSTYPIDFTNLNLVTALNTTNNKTIKDLLESI